MEVLMKEKDPRPTVLSTAIAHENRYFRVLHDHLRWPNGHAGEFFVIEGRPFVVVIAEREGQIALVQQYRYTVERTTTELPKGLVEPGESPEDAARRELREEVNCTGSLVHLATIASSIGNSRKPCHVFLASRCQVLAEGQQKDATEDDLCCRWVLIGDFAAMIRVGEIMEQDSLAAWAIYKAR